MPPKPPAEFETSPELLRQLLAEQRPDLAKAPIVLVDEGWDNAVYQVGPRVAARLPRREAGVPLLAREQQWLPLLASRLPLPVPAPVYVGRPGAGYPWAWSLVPWFEGTPALVEPPSDPESAARALGGFLRALHQTAPFGAPSSPLRGGPLSGRTSVLERVLTAVAGDVDEWGVWALWDEMLALPRWGGRPVWLHGDLHPGNLIGHKGRLSAVIDFGDLCAGDPATDLAVGWMLFDARTRTRFFRVATAESGAGDPNLLNRARGWALALGLVVLAHADDDEAMRTMARRTVAAALAEPASVSA